MLIGQIRKGKTYNASRIALDRLRKGRKVFTNYPIITPDGKYSTLEWKDKYVYEVVTDSDIFIDEAYRKFNSRDFTKFDDDTHLFFSTCGHNGNNIWLLTQNEARIDKAVREIVEEFYLVKKISIPMLGRLLKFPDGDIPLLFIIEVYGSLADLDTRKSNRCVAKEFHLFSPYVAASYNTHYFRGSKKAVDGVSWAEIKKNDIQIQKPVYHNLLFEYAVRLYRTLSQKIS